MSYARAPSNTDMPGRGTPSPRREAEHGLANALSLTICNLELLLVDAKLPKPLRESLEEAFNGALEATRLLNLMRTMPAGDSASAQKSRKPQP